MADYDIGGTGSFKNLIDGGEYSPGEYRYDASTNKMTFIGLPQPIYVFGQGNNLLNGATVQKFIDANAFTGPYNGQTYTATDYLRILRIPYTNGKYVDIGMRAHIYNYGDVQDDHINQLEIYSKKSDGETYNGIVGVWPIRNHRILEDSRMCYFCCYYYTPQYSNTPTITYSFGYYNPDDDDRVISWDEFTSEMMDGHYMRAWLGDLHIPLQLTIDGQTVDVNTSDNTEGDTSGEGGGDGDYDTDSDDIDFSQLPTLSAVGSGILTLWNPSITELREFSNYLWSNDVFDTIKKFISSPMELIVSLSIVPVAPPIQAYTSHLCIGGIDTEIDSHKLTNQYMTYDCGSISVGEYFGSALDYGVYTRISIYLPYIGVRELKTDEIMGGSIHVKYNIDLATGVCVAMVKCTRQNLNSVLYTYEGNMAAQIPLTSRDFSAMYASFAKAAINTAVTGGVGTAASMVGSAMNIMSSKPNMTRSGSISSNGGHLGLHTPYLIIERPIQSLPENASQFYGNPSNITKRLGDLNGYTEVDHIITTGIHCTESEFEEINDLLKSGVYL